MTRTLQVDDSQWSLLVMAVHHEREVWEQLAADLPDLAAPARVVDELDALFEYLQP